MALSRAAANGGWGPACDGPLGDNATAVVLQIARDTMAARPGDPSLTGQGGIALFHHYLSLAFPRGGFAEVARGHLVEAADRLAANESKHWLYGGFTGLAWTVEHIRSCAADGLADEDANEDVDEALLSMLRSAPWPGEYDLIAGLVGLGVYALERLPKPAARDCLVLVIAHLAELARRSGDGVTWWTDARFCDREAAADGRGCHNLGMAHGVPGVIAFLARACTLDPVAATARPLLDGAVRWLLRQRRAGGAASSFGRTVEDPRPARTAWCYGEPGIAVALLAAARAMDDRETERAAIEIGLAAANRRSDETGVVDFGLCHGAAGLAHLYHRLFRATGLLAFGGAARAWVGKTVELFCASPAPRDAGFLHGASGVGLSLLAATSTIEPSWDRVLLCAIPPRQ